jgi:hypothetical protein
MWSSIPHRHVIFITLVRDISENPLPPWELLGIVFLPAGRKYTEGSIRVVNGAERRGDITQGDVYGSAHRRTASAKKI